MANKIDPTVLIAAQPQIEPLSAMEAEAAKGPEDDAEWTDFFGRERWWKRVLKEQGVKE